jgi:hypothetical protein
MYVCAWYVRTQCVMLRTQPVMHASAYAFLCVSSAEAIMRQSLDDVAGIMDQPQLLAFLVYSASTRADCCAALDTPE